MVFVAGLAVTFTTLAPAAAWGGAGHRLIAEVAYSELSPQARQEVDRLIATDASDPVEGCAIDSFADAAVWSDCVRSIPSFRNQSAWHYDDIPICGEPVREEYCASGNCASAAIERGVRMLRNPRATDQQKLRALARVIHFIGDLHQPLHAADNADRGGNEVPVIYLGSPTYRDRTDASRSNNLHGLWDGPLQTSAVGEDPAAAQATIAAMANAHAEWGAGDARAWAAESHAVALHFIYAHWPEPLTCGAPPSLSVVMDEAYVDAAGSIARQQLARAAVRLAATLNDALAD